MRRLRLRHSPTHRQSDKEANHSQHFSILDHWIKLRPDSRFSIIGPATRRLCDNSLMHLVFPPVKPASKFLNKNDLVCAPADSVNCHADPIPTSAVDAAHLMPTPHRITRSARARTSGGIWRPICLAVFKLMTSSNFVGCSTGKSAGLAPLGILST